MLRRIRILGFKSLADVQVELEPLTVLVGPNASGKSNFLDALHLLSRVATAESLDDAFRPPYRGTALESLALAAGGVRDILGRDSASLALEADVELSQQLVERVNRQILELRRPADAAGSSGNGAGSGPLVREKLLRYRVEIQVQPRTGILSVADEKLLALKADLEPNEVRKPFLERQNGRLVLRMERQAHPTYYDLHLNHTILSRPLYPPHCPHMVAARQELASWLFFYFEPRERMRAKAPIKAVGHIGMMGEDLAAFLNTLQARHPLQFRSIVRALHAIVPSISDIEVAPNDMGEVELWFLEGGRKIPASVVSEGTLRVLGLLSLAGVTDPIGLVGYEEPENGVHPNRIRLIAEHLARMSTQGQRQYIVTTHSPLLAEYVPLSSLYRCRQIEGRTDIAALGSELGDLGKTADVTEALDDSAGEPTPVSARIVRGDFGG